MFIPNHFQLIIKYDLINKFLYKNIKKIPKIKKINLNLKYNTKNINFKNLSIAMLSLQLIFRQKGKLILLTKKPKLPSITKIRKGYPIGCKIILKKIIIQEFFFNLLTNILPKIKNFYGIKLIKKIYSLNTISFKIISIIFDELEKHHNLFKNLPSLNFNITTNNTKTTKELYYLITSYKFPLILKNG